MNAIQLYFYVTVFVDKPHSDEWVTFIAPGSVPAPNGLSLSSTHSFIHPVAARHMFILFIHTKTWVLF